MAINPRYSEIRTVVLKRPGKEILKKAKKGGGVFYIGLIDIKTHALNPIL